MTSLVFPHNSNPNIFHRLSSSSSSSLHPEQFFLWKISSHLASMGVSIRLLNLPNQFRSFSVEKLPWQKTRIQYGFPKKIFSGFFLEKLVNFRAHCFRLQVCVLNCGKCRVVGTFCFWAKSTLLGLSTVSKQCKKKPSLRLFKNTSNFLIATIGFYTVSLCCNNCSYVPGAFTVGGPFSSLHIASIKAWERACLHVLVFLQARFLPQSVCLSTYFLFPYFFVFPFSSPPQKKGPS